MLVLDPTVNYDQARQLPNGKWHYTRRNDGDVWAIGHCSKYQLCPDCKGQTILASHETCSTCDEKGVLVRENPCPGHDTEEEACEHYRQYLLDEHLRWHTYENCAHKCMVCGEWTSKFTMVGGYDLLNLCDKHATREVVETLLPKVGSSVHS